VASKPEDQPHAQADLAALAYASEPAMPCPNPAGNAMPATGGDGEGAVPHARRG
jgi:hypothetical protein